MRDWYIVRDGKDTASEFLVDKKLTRDITWTTNIGWAMKFFTKDVAEIVAARFKNVRLVDEVEAYRLNEDNRNHETR